MGGTQECMQHDYNYRGYWVGGTQERSMTIWGSWVGGTQECMQHDYNYRGYWVGGTQERSMTTVLPVYRVELF